MKCKSKKTLRVNPITLLSSIATGVKGCVGIKLWANLYIWISHVLLINFQYTVKPVYNEQVGAAKSVR